MTTKPALHKIHKGILILFTEEKEKKMPQSGKLKKELILRRMVKQWRAKNESTISNTGNQQASDINKETEE